MWLATAKVVTRGLGALPALVQQAMLWGVIAGVALTTLEHFAPRVRRWLPSATGIALGLVIPFQYPLSFFIGAVLSWLWNRRRPEQAERFMVPVASGVIAGESLAGVLVAVANNFLIRR